LEVLCLKTRPKPKTTITSKNVIAKRSFALEFDLQLFAEKGTGKNIPTWKGSGPTPGVLGLNANSKSIKAIQNYYPKNGGIEYVFDPKTNTFAVGRPIDGLYDGSPHQQLARSIGADESTVLGGMFRRGANGEIYTSEDSGHYGYRWTPELRGQFENTMNDYGITINHQSWGK
jgi:hypothetical protein